MNSKGSLIWLHLDLIVVVVLVSVFVWTSLSVAEDKIGSDQSKVFSAFQEGQKELFYLDFSAKYALINSVYRLALNGGFSSESACGDYYGVSLWSYKNSEGVFVECFPSLVDEIVPVFSSLLGRREVFRFFADDRKGLSITGASPSPVNITIGASAERVYSFRPAFSEHIDYSGKAYAVIKDFVEKLNEKCSAFEGSVLIGCVQDFLADYKHDFVSLGIIKGGASPEYAVREALKQLERMNFVECYAPFKWDENYAVDFLSGISEKGFHTTAVSSGKKIADADVAVEVASEGSSGALAPYPSSKVSVLKNVLSYDSVEKEMDSHDFFVFPGRISAFLPLEEKRRFAGYLWQRPCEYENRAFAFELVEKSIYPGKGDVVYDFAVYVKDEKAPVFSGFSAEDKEFDENSLLVKWRHTDSLDLKRYEVYVDGKLSKSFSPWEGVEVYDNIEWGSGGGAFRNCRLVDYNGFKKCFYSGVDIERGGLYFFSGSGEFVYAVSPLSSGRHSVSVIAFDDDNNQYEAETEGFVVDDLPLQPLSEYLVNPILLPPDESSYEAVSAVPLGVPLWNMDGSRAVDFSGYRLFEDVKGSVAPGEGADADVPVVLLRSVHSLAVPSEFLLVPDDPSLENIPLLYLDEMGYSAVVVPFLK